MNHVKQLYIIVAVFFASSLNSYEPWDSFRNVVNTSKTNFQHERRKCENEEKMDVSKWVKYYHYEEACNEILKGIDYREFYEEFSRFSD